MGSDYDYDRKAKRQRYDVDGESDIRESRSMHEEGRKPSRDSRRDRPRSRERRRRSRTPGPEGQGHRRRRDREGDRQGNRSRDGSRERERHRDRDRRRDHRSHRAEGSSDRDRDRQSVRQRGPLPSQQDSFAVTQGEEPEKPKEKPNFGTTGVLAAVSNSVKQEDGSSVTLKYHEPPEARKPPPRDEWKLFVFKGPDIVDTIDLGLRTCWLMGREVAVADLPTEHPSVSKQHAVIQFRYTEKRNEYGDKIGRVKPYLIDLESANGTSLNGDKVPESRYLELRDKDMFQLGDSTREYVVMLAPKH